MRDSFLRGFNQKILLDISIDTIDYGHIRLVRPEEYSLKIILIFVLIFCDRLCGLVVGVPGYRSRDPGSDSRRYQIF
jgi:hypothetical protein